jgi:multidrug efflux pump subunit AcrB
VHENFFRDLAGGAPSAVAAEQGGREMALPVLAASLTTVIVFFPVTFLFGVSRFLFGALAISVVLALAASYFVALTVIPLCCARMLSARGAGASATEAPASAARRSTEAAFARLSQAYGRTVDRVIARPAGVIAGLALVFAASLPLYTQLKVAFFPRTDASQFVINLKAQSGTRLEVAEEEVRKVEALVREVVAPADLGVILSNIGVTPDFSAMYTSNSAQHTAFVQVNLNEHHQTGSYEYMERLRARLHTDLPELTAYFQSGGLADAVLNMGLPAPIDVQISGSDLAASYRIAADIASRAREVSGVSDVFVPQDLDYPALKVQIDRTSSSKLGLTQREIVQNVITALTSNQMVAPSYWVDQRTGNDYMLTVQYPEDQIRTLDDLAGIPLRSAERRDATRLDAVSTISRIESPTEVDHYQLRRLVDVYVAPSGEDLGRVANAIDRLIHDTAVPDGVRVELRGMVQGMRSAFTSFGSGLLLAIALLYLILVAQCRSFLDPLLILSALPLGITGVLVTLYTTGTSLNVMSLMGTVMMVGVVVSNSILIVHDANTLRDAGQDARSAIRGACGARFRAILMTSIATVVGLVPLAIRLGTGGEAYVPMARAIIGGMTASVATSVFLVPALWWLANRRRAAVVRDA